MKRLMRNREQLIDMLLPILGDWAAVEGYIMPSKVYLLKFDVELNAGEKYLQINDQRDVLANITQTSQVVRLAMDHENASLISSMIHEYAHAVQFYNLGAQFTPQYSQATTTYGYERNPFEIQARGAESCLRAHVNRNTFLRRAIETFKWLTRMHEWECTDELPWFFEKPRFRDWEHQGFWRTRWERRGRP